MTFDGKPATGARIVGNFNWKDDNGETEGTIADNDGRFSFTSHWDVLRRVLPVEFVVHQSIFVHYKDNKYQVWETGKREKIQFSEFGGKSKNFRCELTDEIRRVDLERGFVGTNCYWDIIE
ncbi:MAG: DUF4198 domain-containing protein [Desulfobulbaceae bacterium]|nr:DUF4198 domain-containing protein [Desulfobulbaceae bacterium]